VIDTVNQAAKNFTPPICVEGLTLGGVLDFSSTDARVFGLTTDGVTPGSRTIWDHGAVAPVRIGSDPGPHGRARSFFTPSTASRRSNP
jgi:hypothetical protein